MIKTFLILALLITSAAVLQAAPKAKGVRESSATVKEHGRAVEKLEKIDAVAASETGETREVITGLGYKLGKDLLDMDVDKELVKAARDKSLNWRTRAILIERINREEKKQITNEEELSLYSDALMDAKEHNEVRKVAAQALMEPARKEPRARAALTKAAKDKSLPGDVLWSVMVSVGSSGIDDVDVLAKLMGREPKAGNDIAINLNAVRALGKSNDPRAVGMLLKVLDESVPDSYYNVTALEQFAVLSKDLEKGKLLRPMLVPRLLKLLDDRSDIGASRGISGRILARMNERRAVAPVMKWLSSKEMGGGQYPGDLVCAAEILAEFQAKEAIPELQKIIGAVWTDNRWEETRKVFKERNLTFPEGVPEYQSLVECLKKLKGEKYKKALVDLSEYN
jgi:hypothetical protein